MRRAFRGRPAGAGRPRVRPHRPRRRSSGGWPRALGVDPHDLARRLTAGRAPGRGDARRRSPSFHAQGIRTALVSNSWRADDYDLDDLFDAIVLSRRARHPQARPARSTSLALERLGVAAGPLRLRRRPRRQPQARESPGYDHNPARHGLRHDRPAQTSTSARSSFLTRSQQTRRSSFHVCGKDSRTGPRRGPPPERAVPGRQRMYHFSRSIYRELAPDIIEERERRDREPRARAALLRDAA